MRDPFPIKPIPWLSDAIQPFADYTSFTTLPLHIHEILISFFGYAFVERVAAPLLSGWLFPRHYGVLSSKRKLNWDVHVVSLVQSTLINILSLWVLFADEERKNMTWQERIWGYTGAVGMIQALATGYFIWDLMVSVIHVKSFGPGMLVHAMSALLVFSFGFRPFVNFYAITFILYELSSPFLNFHWFFDKLGMTGSRAQLLNGILLLVVFFSCRLVWGTYQSFRVFQDVWAALHYQPEPGLTQFTYDGTLNNETIYTSNMDIRDLNFPRNELMRFARDKSVPVWLSFIYLGSNVVLNFLNYYWFRQMIITLRRRFKPRDNYQSKISTEDASSTKAHDKEQTSVVDADKPELRRRNILADEQNQTMKKVLKL
ncbi:hypothetical protein K3495_g6778 [Podosphaera aphanis]|nr:hypothetical protein K3495_g6778 [Podosphaera aphanis]